MAEITFGEAYSEARRGASGASVMHLAGGVVSVALIVGALVWGGKLIWRDVSGVPVVQAMSDGPMRVAPENPGGEIAPHAGLTVNTVAAVGEAGAPEDRLVLAPSTVDLVEEDLAVAPAVPQPETATAGTDALELENITATASDSEAPLSADEVLALADQIAAQAVEESAAAVAAPEEVAGAPDAAAPAQTDRDAAVRAALEAAVAAAPVRPVIEVIPASVPGVSRSYRPALRPGSPALSGVTPVSANVPSVPVLDTALAAGTKLVQLGAYDTADMARADWARISTRFADFLIGKSPVIQKAESGGRTFFRLRAQGFADINDARRFCSVLMAENAACIPVVVR